MPHRVNILRRKQPETGGEHPKAAAPSPEERRDSPLADTAPASGLDQPGVRPATADAESLPTIAGYEVLEEIGRGGWGVVYRARQLAAGGRVVALKVMLDEAFARPEDLRRFEREVEIAADLNHPGIARIYDSGLTHDRHYFAMEHVAGEHLDHYCAARNLPLAERLRLFTRVCEAVAFAHRRGVIHRDLKPSNIKVDAEGQPHILDFGLAKLQAGAGEAAESRSELTMAGTLLGTLQYMAPEQAEGKVSAIDTRTDVYALGVILYEMLTGRYPYEVTGQMAEVLKRIAEAEPRRPSTVNRLIGDEVETIVLRSLSKDPDRRYPGADDLSRDVLRFLAGEPIEAKRDSGWYVFRKGLARHWVPVTAGAIAAVVVLAFAIASFSLYRGAEAARKDAELERDRARSAESSEAKQRAAAQQALAEVQRENYFNAISAAAAKIEAQHFVQAEASLWEQPTELRNIEWGLLMAACHQDMLTLDLSPARVVSMAFSCDGRRLAIGCDDGAIRLLDLTTGRLEPAWSGHKRPVCDVAFSPDDRLLASAASDGAVRLWNTASGLEATQFQGNAACVAFSPDGELLGAGLRVWNVADGRLLHDHWREPPPSTGPTEVHSINIVAFPGQVMEAVPLWTRTPDTNAMVDRTCGSLAAFLDGGKLAISTDLTVWDVASGRVVRRRGDRVDRILAFELSHDGRFLGAIHSDYVVRSFTTGDGAVYRLFEGHRAHLTAIGVSRDGRVIVTGDADGLVRSWWLDGSAIRACRGHSRAVCEIAVSPDGRVAASASEDGCVKVWNADGIAGLACREEQRSVDSLAFRPAGELIGATVVGDGARTVIEVTDFTRDVRWRSRESSNETWRTALSCDGEAVLACQDRAGWEVWAVTSSVPVKAQPPPGDLPAVRPAEWEAPEVRPIVLASLPPMSQRPLALGPGGQPVLSASSEQFVLGGPDAARTLGPMPRRLDEVTRPVFSADGSRLLLATDRTSVKIWDTRTAACQATLEHPGPVLAAAFVPRTSQIVTGGAELRLWDSANTGRYSTLRGHAADVRVVAASADGTRLLSGGDDGSVKLWGLPDGREILSLRFTSEPIALAKYGLFDQYSEIGFALIAPPGSALAVATSPRRSLYTTPMVKLWRVTDWRLTREQLLERKRQDYLAWIATLPTDPRSSSAARAGKGSE